MWTSVFISEFWASQIQPFFRWTAFVLCQIKVFLQKTVIESEKLTTRNALSNMGHTSTSKHKSNHKTAVASIRRGFTFCDPKQCSYNCIWRLWFPPPILASPLYWADFIEHHLSTHNLVSVIYFVAVVEKFVECCSCCCIRGYVLFFLIPSVLLL